MTETIGVQRVYPRMSGHYRAKLAGRLLIAAVPMALIGASAGANESAKPSDPMRFFEGRTESISTVKVITQKPFQSRSMGRGVISDGTLSLIQRVHDEGKAPFDRRWRMRQVAPGRFTGTMTEAAGPILAEEIDGRYRFRFKMKGHVSVEQWLTPLPGGDAAQSRTIIRKFGMKVGSSEGTVRKL